MKKIGIYVHIPFCQKKCDYCDFVSYAGQEEKIEQYIKALKKEIVERAKEIQEPVMVDTIYLGGGTPSYLPYTKIEEILETIFHTFSVEKEAEVTIEVNPGTVNREKLEAYKKSGCNRISIGLQAVQNGLLKKIGRIHTFEQFLETYTLAKEIGFDNQNVDLMLGLPEQSLEDLEKSIDTIIALQPKHISVYSLIVEENTILERKLEKGEYDLPDEEMERSMYWKVKETLEQNGYEHYEISNFAKPRILLKT